MRSQLEIKICEAEKIALKSSNVYCESVWHFLLLKNTSK